MDVARLEARNFKINPEPMDVSTVATEVADAFKELALEAKVDLQVHAEPVPQIEADPQRVAQVFFNLLSNAIKFTPPGGHVRIATRTDGDMVVGSVQDSGVGLRSEDFQRLFQPFSQIEDPDLNTPRRGGTGLGLYITQGIIEQHGGRIWCDSQGPNKGSTFAFALPLALDTDEIGGEMAEDPSPRKHGVWPFIYFHCPMCDSRDIDMRLLRNTYECKRCDYAWR
jgi:signal transduction histidine kinase